MVCFIRRRSRKQPKIKEPPPAVFPIFNRIATNIPSKLTHSVGLDFGASCVCVAMMTTDRIHLLVDLPPLISADMLVQEDPHLYNPLRYEPVSLIFVSDKLVEEANKLLQNPKAVTDEQGLELAAEALATAHKESVVADNAGKAGFRSVVYGHYAQFLSTHVASSLNDTLLSNPYQSALETYAAAQRTPKPGLKSPSYQPGVFFGSPTASTSWMKSSFRGANWLTSPRAQLNSPTGVSSGQSWKSIGSQKLTFNFGSPIAAASSQKGDQKKAANKVRGLVSYASAKSLQKSSLICGLRTLMGLRTMEDLTIFKEAETWPFSICAGEKGEPLARVGQLMDMQPADAPVTPTPKQLPLLGLPAPLNTFNSLLNSTSSTASFLNPAVDIDAAFTPIRSLNKTPMALGVLYLGHIRRSIDKVLLQKVTHVVLAVSPSLTSAHVDLLKQACSSAGFLRVDVLLYPFAVVLAYLEYRHRRDRKKQVASRALTSTVTPHEKMNIVVYWGASCAEVCCVVSHGNDIQSMLRLVGVQVLNINI